MCAEEQSHDQIAELICRQLAFFSELGVTHLRIDRRMPPAESAEPAERSESPEVSLKEPRPASSPSPAEETSVLTLPMIREELGECTRCKLSSTRTHIVFGVGDQDADLMFIGEAPGEDEDLQGEPFVGAAGKLLTKIIAAMGLTREQVYIANILKCRPPNNRNPHADEVAACEPFLFKQIAAVRPLVIVALGKYAAQTLLETDEWISRLRGRFFDYRGTLLMPTFHPSYLLRNPSAKRQVWDDVQAVVRKLKELGSDLYPPDDASMEPNAPAKPEE